MANRSSRQNSATSPASQVRRSSRKSVVEIPGQSQRRPSSARRASHRHPAASLIDDFDWANLDPDYIDQNFNDILAADDNLGFDVPPLQDNYTEYRELPPQNLQSEFVSVPMGRASSNLYENPGVAVPGTPHIATFPHASQQTGASMGNQPAMMPANAMLVNGLWMVPASPQVAALFSQAEPQTMLTDGKRTSVPKSPRFTPRRQASQLRVQVPNQPGLVHDGFLAQDYYGTVDPSQLAYSKYPEPEFVRPAYQDPEVAHYTQPYYQSSYQHGNNNHAYSQGAPSPGGRLSKRLRSHPPEPEDEPVSKQTRTSKVSKSFQNMKPKAPPVIDILEVYANAYQSPSASARSVSTYPSRNSSGSGGSRNNSHTGRKNKTRQSKPLDKRASVFDREAQHKFQKPKLNPRNPAVRINKTTKGETTRTAKINEYNPCDYYTYSEHPLGDWSSDRFDHQYRAEALKDENTGQEVLIFEMADRVMSAAKIRDFILNYPKDNTLTLRIQVGPGDSGGRYVVPGSKCRFADCPSREAGLNGTILHGWYRVAFDERNDDNYDPFAACCGFAHLYCMERFLDFEYICRKANVVVESRVSIPTEPKGKFAATLGLSHQEASYVADRFIKAAQSKQDKEKTIHRQRGDPHGVRRLPEFANYPVHEYFPDGAEKPYQHTLNFEMVRRRTSERGFSQLNQFATKGKNGLGPSLLSVHYGDLDMVSQAHTRDARLKKAAKKAKAKGRTVSEIDTYDSDSPFSIKVRAQIERAKRELARAETTARPRKRQAPRNTPRPPRVEPYEVTDDESGPEYNEDRYDETYRNSANSPAGSRRSKRIQNSRQQPDYRDEPENNHQQYPVYEADFNDLGLGYSLAPSPARQRSLQNPGHFMTGDNSQLDQQHKRKRASQNYEQYSYMQHDYGNHNVENERPTKRKRSSGPPQGYQRARSYRPGQEFYYPMENQEQVLNRRMSSIPGRNSIMRQPGSRTPSTPKRHASFNTQPVSREKTFDSQAPPQNVQPRMVKELQEDLTKQRGSKKGETTVRQTRSGRSFGSTSD